MATPSATQLHPTGARPIPSSTDAKSAPPAGEAQNRVPPLQLVVTSHRLAALCDPMKKSLDLLHADLYDSRESVAVSALSAVESLADDRSFPFVGRLLSTAGQAVKCAAVRALGSFRHPDALPLLLESARTTNDEKLQIEILATLAAKVPENTDVIALIRTTALSPVAQPALRELAGSLFLKICGPIAFDELLVDTRGENLEGIIAAAVENEELQSRTVAHFAPLYPRLPASARANLISIAATQQLPQSIELIVAGLADTDTEVRRAAYASIGTEAHHDAWFSHLVGTMAESAETIPAVEDEALAAISRMAKLSEAGSIIDPGLRKNLISEIEGLYEHLKRSSRRVDSDSHELGWLITRSAEYLEYYGNGDFKSDLLRWLKGTSMDSVEHITRKLKDTAVRVEVRHFDGFSALAELIKNPRRSGMGLVTRELTLVHTGKSRVLWQLVRAIRLCAILLAPEVGGTHAGLLKDIYTWARHGKLFRLAEAALCALAKVDPPAAEYACLENLTIPLASKILAIGSLHLLRELHLDLLEPMVARLVDSQDDQFVTMNALEAITLPAPSTNGELAAALLTRLSVTSSPEVRSSLVAFLGERMGVDIIERLREPLLAGSKEQRAAALSIIDRRVSNGLVTNRERTLELLYGVLRGEDQSNRRSAAVTLWKLGDDYSAKVIGDFFLTDDAESVAEVVRGINGYLREPIVSSIAPLFARDNAAIHEAVRQLFLQSPDVSVRRRALDMVIDARGDALCEDEDPTEVEAVTPAIELSSERSAFQFERENMEELVMFFSDIQGYSKKAQSLTPMQLSELVTEYEKILLTHVETHGGQLVKRMGDGHMIVFRKPLPAVLAAIRLQKSLRRFNRYRDETNRVVIRIGVHSGKVVRNSQGDVLGNAVNVASRLESSARPGSILISDLIQERIADAVHSREIGRITVKNISEPIRVYEPYEIKVNLPGELDPLQGGGSESSQDLTVSDSVTLDRETYVEVIRCFSALISVCKNAVADQVPIRELNTHVLDRLNRLRPRLPKPAQQRRSQDGK